MILYCKEWNNSGYKTGAETVSSSQISVYYKKINVVKYSANSLNFYSMSLW